MRGILTQEQFDSLSPDIQELIDLETMDLREEFYEPVKIGPTWQKNEDGSWHLPEYTLGWEIAQWCSRWFRGPDGSHWKFSLEQLRWLLWWYAVDEDGKFIYRKGIFQRLKGHGKDPMAAILCLVELCGPCRVGGWEDGKPVGTRVTNALVQIAAVNQAQSRNTSDFFGSLATDEFIAEYGVNFGAEITYANQNAKLLNVTSNPRALQGQRVSFAILNETHEWVAGNKGQAMYEVIKLNAEKVDGRWLAITNAYLPGEESVAEVHRTEYENWVQGRLTQDPRVMYDSLEAHPRAPIHPLFLKRILLGVRGDSVWLPVDNAVESMMDTTVSLAKRIRMWFNRVVAGENALFGPDDYEKVKTESKRLMPGDKIVLGFDGGKTDDSTALIAMRVEDGLTQLIRVWEKPEDAPRAGRTDVKWQAEAGVQRWQVDTEEVDAKIAEVFDFFEVVGFYADVHPWESYIDSWNRRYGERLLVKSEAKNAIGWDMRGSLMRSTKANEALMSSILEERIEIVDNVNIKAHMLNAFRRENNFGVSFGKESRESSRKVDIYAAMMLAHECRRDYFGKVKVEEERQGSEFWAF